MLLGLDIGTTSIKAVLYDPAQGQVVRRAARPTPVDHPQPGWSEHDPAALWATTVQCIREAANGAAVRALAISSMAETGLLLDTNMQPVAPAIAWFDRRSEPQAARIEQEISIERLYQITGQRASPSFGITKLLWIKENQPTAFHRGSHWLPVPAYLLWRLTGAAAVDYSIASRTLAYDQHTGDWSREVLGKLDLPVSLFPAVHPGGTAVGSISPQAAEETGLPLTAICVLGGHDHLCAALAAGALAPGALTDSSGTANALLLLLPKFQTRPGMAERGYSCSPHVLKNVTVLKGGLKAAGHALDWLARLLAGSGGEPDYTSLEKAAAEGIGRRAGPLWLPHLIGSGTPEGDRFSRAAAMGMQLEHTAGDLYRGMLESLAFWTRHNLDEMQSLTGIDILSLTLIGGVTRIELLSRLKASVVNRVVRVPQVPEAAAVGAALLAGLGNGLFNTPGEALGSLTYACRTVEPEPALNAWYERLYQEAYLPLYQALKPTHRVLEEMDRRAIP